MQKSLLKYWIMLKSFKSLKYIIEKHVLDEAKINFEIFVYNTILKYYFKISIYPKESFKYKISSCLLCLHNHSSTSRRQHKKYTCTNFMSALLFNII